MTTMTMLTDDEILTIAAETAGDRAKVSWHDGDDGHRAVRVTGCYPEVADQVGAEIAARLLPACDPETGRYPADSGPIGYRNAAGFAAVWVR